jgi:hypothetical protein
LASYWWDFVSGDKPWEFDKVKLGSWSRGESYMEDILEVWCTISMATLWQDFYMPLYLGLHCSYLNMRKMNKIFILY